MKIGRVIAVVVIVAAVAGGGVLAYQRTQGGGVPSSAITMQWRGKYHGQMTIPARFNWCPGTRRGVIEAISGDSGIGVVFVERDSLTSGPHVVVSPELSANQVPSAALAMRWMRFQPDTGVTGFRGRGGTVRVTYRSGKASGDINARMGTLTDNDTLVVQGSFRDIPVVTTAAGCS